MELEASKKKTTRERGQLELERRASSTRQGGEGESSEKGRKRCTHADMFPLEKVVGGGEEAEQGRVRSWR